eukprot:9445745-Ditylum_brightwellii.AAC.1
MFGNNSLAEYNINNKNNNKIRNPYLETLVERSSFNRDGESTTTKENNPDEGQLLDKDYTNASSSSWRNKDVLPAVVEEEARVLKP